ncbi:OmpH family outer membrane protein [Mucilaginibacter sp. AW1-3]
MKKLLGVVLVATCLLFTANLAKAQQKIGYVNFNAVIDVMPDKAVIAKNMQDYQKTFADQYQLMQTELQTKGADYEKNKATWNDAIRTQKEAEITDIQNRMQTFSQKAQQSMEAHQNELAKPLFDKVKLAVQTVAKEKGYTYVFDSSQQIMVVYPDGDDLTAAVKLKLGAK